MKYLYAVLFSAAIAVFLTLLFLALAFVVLHPEMCCN